MNVRYAPGAQARAKRGRVFVSCLPKMLDRFFKADIIAVFLAVHAPAQVAKLVDALGSGPSGGNTVEVRVLSWAPN